jgi:hypothetical protein
MFCFDTITLLDYNAIVLKKNGDYMDAKDMLDNKGRGYTDKKIEFANNIHKMLIAGFFKWKNNYKDL